MSPSTFFNTEYDLLDSDDSTGNSPIPFLEFINDSDALQALDASRVGDSKALQSPKPHLAVPQAGATVDSPCEFSGSSSSDSSSSKRAESASSTKTDMTSGDVMMADGLGMKAEPDWEPENYVNGDANGFLFDGTIDPSSIENTFDFGDRNMDNNHFEFASASNTPSPFATTATSTTDAVSPQAQFNQHYSSVKVSPYASKSPNHGHYKGFSQYSLTQSMNGLNTRGSREVSPASQMVLSHDSSPSAFLNSSPSPTNHVDFMNGSATGKLNGAAWSQGLSIAPSPLQQANAIGTQMNLVTAAAAMPTSMQFPLFQQPSQPAVPQLFIGPTPAKSRVETQIPIRISMSNLPQGIRRLHLPTHTISKPKLLAKPRPERSPDMLELSTMLVCTSAMSNSDVKRKALARAASAAHPTSPDPRTPDASLDEDDKAQNGGEVKICDGCVTRERKRAARKKAKKPEEEERWSKDERRRVVVFNTQEVKEWQMPTAIVPNSNPPEQVITGGAMQIDAPMRIACYCRHHGEKSGFQVIFTVKDYQGKLIAQAFSPSIMITDDHKTHTTLPGVPGGANNNSESSLAAPVPSGLDVKPLNPGELVRSPQSGSELQGLKRNVSATFPSAISSQAPSTIASARTLSRPPSPSGLSGPSSKKRKSSSSPKVPSGLAMTRLETSNLSASQPPAGQNGPAGTPSPFTPSMGSFPVTSADAMFGQNTATTGTVPNSFTTGPPTPNSNDQVMFSNANRSSSMDNLSLTQMYSAPVSAHPSRAPSPNGLRNSANVMQHQHQQAQLNQALQHNLFNLSMPVAMTPATPSVIHKVIPNEGPKSGGIEVTILGEGFYQGLEVMFGDRRATTTTFWGETSLVCLLPPSHLAGPVRVTLKSPNGQPCQPFSSVSKQQPLFNYIDDYENQLIRSALSVMSHKMTGKLEDAREIARRLMFNNDTSGGGSSAGNSAGYTLNFETQLLRVLEFLDLDDSSNKVRLNLRRRSGQTMLHLACALGLHRFVAGLLARGANADARDKGGYTPMHLAALNDHPEIVRRLIQAGADPTIRTIGGLTPAEVATSRDVLRAIRRIERHARSRSGGSLHSRANSATSLRSLWEPTSSARATTTAVEFSTSTEESESAGESPEYTSGDLSSEEADVDELDGPWLDMRRTSTHSQRRRATDVSPPQVPAVGARREPASPTAAMTAFREQFTAQFQQFQQAMAMHFQNLPQFPSFSQMPNMPPLPDYQALQRMTSFLPHIGGGSRPGSAGDQPQTKEMDSRWWALSSFMSSSAPPPAYEELFPQSQLDKKQASAALAAADAEADSKCATLYDEASTSTATSSPQQTPKVLEIGRKHRITKEQRENLRRAHAKNFKGIRSDHKLFFVWIPLLVLVLCAMLYNRFPGLFARAWGILPSFNLTPVVRTAEDRVIQVN
ncbi:Ankyrin repeat protein [Pleurostoma richardsiae]|uniref:Ankyrin repeat protein n=1 Tax=Pleurostoma richardsiae TaxID=41990 RepID=A0AA38RLC7_9PEZI|nr:Ankyrin repeat protein [Pleurostoma richardsiae]